MEPGNVMKSYACNIKDSFVHLKKYAASITKTITDISHDITRIHVSNQARTNPNWQFSGPEKKTQIRVNSDPWITDKCANEFFAIG